MQRCQGKREGFKEATNEQDKKGRSRRKSGEAKVGLPQNTLPGVLRFFRNEPRLHSPPSVLGRLYRASNVRNCRLPLHGEGCNEFDLMHSRNKLYCRVACVQSRFHFSRAPGPRAYPRVCSRSSVCSRAPENAASTHGNWLSLETSMEMGSSLLHLHRSRIAKPYFGFLLP